MSSREEWEEWLQAQPLGELVEVDGESVYLQPYGGGTELGAVLIHSCTPGQIRDALQQGFASAMHYGAGLALSADGEKLLLTQWLPYVSGWAQAADSLEALLNQLEAWRAELVPPRPEQLPEMSVRTEARLRGMLSGARR